MRSLAALIVFAACSSTPATPAPVQPTPVKPDQPTANAAKPDPGPPPALKLDGSVAAPTGYDVEMTIDANKDSYDGRVVIAVEVKKPTPVIWLNAHEIEVTDTGVTAATQPLDGAQTIKGDDQFVAVGVPGGFKPGPHKLALRYTAKIGKPRAFTGVFAQEEKGKKYLYTQFEAIGARRAFPCFDQPEFKTPWKLAIKAPTGQRVYANTPGTGAPNDKKFAASKPIPSYLVAFAVGPFEEVDIGRGGRNKVPMRVIVPAGRTGEVGHAKKTIPETLARLETYFDQPYPYAKLDSIALPEFFGAMENPGLITYHAGILLVDPGKVGDGWRRSHLMVVAHELAHQWFGNLVTLRWWDDLWLNESFASWMAEKMMAKLRPDWDPAIRRISTRDGSMAIDVNESTRPIRNPVTERGDIFGLFNAGITYGKGSVVIEMFERWIGEDQFREGMREYMRTHAWKTTTAADFFTSLAKVSDDKLPGAFATFIDQSGVPLITVNLDCAGEPSLQLSQSRLTPAGSKTAPSSRRWQIPVCVKYGVRSKQFQTCKLIDKPAAKLAVSAGKRCPDWVVANAETAGYYRVKYGSKVLDKILRASAKLTTADRIGVIGDVSALMNTGQVSVADALGLIPKLMRDKNPDIVSSAVKIAASIEPNVPDKLHPKYQRFIARTFGRQARQLGWIDRESDSRVTEKLRRSLVPLVAHVGRDRKLLREANKLARAWLKDPKAIDRESLPMILRAAAATGDSVMFKQFFGKAKDSDDRRVKRSVVQALAHFPDRNHTLAGLEMTLDDKLPMQATFGLLQRMLESRDKREIAYEFVEKNLEKLADKLPAMAKGFMAMVPAAMCDASYKPKVDDFAKRLAGAPGLERSVKNAKEAIDSCVAQRAQQRSGIEKFLRRY